jgi:hypothetical protein
MKKSWTVALIIALAVAGALLTGCSPSEADEGNIISDWNIELKGGKYQYVFTSPKIEHDKTYTVTFTIEDCDESLSKSDGHFGGKISYKMNLNDENEDDKVLSGWQNATPQDIDASPRSYTWTFKAGQKYSDSKDVENPATTPSGATQYFDLTAQTSSWSGFGANDNFKVKGKFEVALKEEVTTWIPEGELTLGNVDGTQGKGELSAADVAKILALPDDGIIKFYVSVTVNSSDAQPGYGVCGVSPTWSGGISLTIPGGAAYGPLDFTQDVEIGALKSILGTASTIIINPYNGAVVTKAELFRPGP